MPKLGLGEYVDPTFVLELTNKIGGLEETGDSSGTRHHDFHSFITTSDNYLHLFLYVMMSCKIVCADMCAHACALLEDREQLIGVHSLLLACGLQGLNSSDLLGGPFSQEAISSGPICCLLFTKRFNSGSYDLVIRRVHKALPIPLLFNFPCDCCHIPVVKLVVRTAV